MEPTTITLELTRDEITALSSFAAVGITALAALTDGRSLTEKDIALFTNAALALNKLTPAGWSALNDQIITSVFLAWPEARIERETV